MNNFCCPNTWKVIEPIKGVQKNLSLELLVALVLFEKYKMSNPKFKLFTKLGMEFKKSIMNAFSALHQV